MHPRIVAVEVVGPFVVKLQFADHTEGTVDLGSRLRDRGGLFAALADPEFFARVAVDREAGTIAWPNGLDLDPDVLYVLAHETERTLSL